MFFGRFRTWTVYIAMEVSSNILLLQASWESSLYFCLYLYKMKKASKGAKMTAKTKDTSILQRLQKAFETVKRLRLYPESSCYVHVSPSLFFPVR
jgi:hypothetical protein